MNRYITFVLITLLLGGCTAWKEKVSRTDMSAVALGMSQDDVSSAIGQPLNVVEATQFGDQKLEVWEYPAGHGDRFRVYFADGRVEAWRRTYY
jgi:hypothetical protein